ncbi:hypothetical protein CYY_006502 [Polysphondylium violaceum]|uniref:ACB domain-containing protein n=1 Tax=Polysphondylium violaceum TaxID=133409 RepID=A0A8J4V330_9MYCE|nr:hypothetical protein CYY_006502 [Polysphondylium violaceum]
MIESQFQKAVEYISKKSDHLTLSNEQQLYFYCQFKQATIGDINTKSPPFYDYIGRSKWNSWKSLEGIDKVTAMTNYINYLTKVAPNWIDTTQTPAEPTAQSVFEEDDPQEQQQQDKNKMGPVISRFSMVDQETIDELNKNQKEDLSYWVSMNSIDKVKEMINEKSINERDEEGRTPLMWSCDRGLVDIAKLLLDSGSNVNSQDNEGMTPLHYACVCTHKEIIQLLLSYNADKSIKDNSDTLPIDLLDSSSDSELIKLLN